MTLGVGSLIIARQYGKAQLHHCDNGPEYGKLPHG